jgi:tetratricopeptide (TPR) repeat protein
MPPFQKAILLVNAGARALHLIRQAIVAMKDEVPLDDSDLCLSREMLRVAPPLETTSDAVECDGRYLLYSRPLEFPTEGCRISCQREFERVRQSLSLYTVFNLALACQQFGMASGASAPLQRAMELYYSLLNSPFDSLVDDDRTINYSLLHCLVLNNLAYIHRERMEFDESQDCAEWMVETWESTGCLEDCSAFLSEREAEEIKVNGIFLQPPSAAQAA